MRDLEKMFDEAVAIIKECIEDVEMHPIKRPITINNRAKSRVGQCSRNTKTDLCKIEISKYLLGDAVPYEMAMSTIIHEILHACKGCFGHTGRWARYADMVNARYPQYNIKRTADLEDYGLEAEYAKSSKYAVVCTKCGKAHFTSRLTKVIQFPENYRCKCGGDLKRIDPRDFKPARVPAFNPLGQMCLADFM